MSSIEAIRDRYLEQIDAATDGDALEAIRLAALGKKGEISLLLKTLGQMTPEERQDQGPKINGARQAVAEWQGGIALAHAMGEAPVLSEAFLRMEQTVSG